jgi:hypothetical protein
MSRQPPSKRVAHEPPPPRRKPPILVPPDHTIDEEPTLAGAAHRAIRARYPDATELEYGWGMAPLVAPGWFADPADAVARVWAMGQARREEPTLSDEAWWHFIDEVESRLFEMDRQDPDVILAAVRQKIAIDLEILTRAPRPPDPESHGFTERAIRESVADERRVCFGPPRQPQVAARLHTSVRTLQHAMKALGMGNWPPANPGGPRRSA